MPRSTTKSQVWTPAQDALLMNLTEEGLSTAVVAQVCARTELEVVNRHRELTLDPEPKRVATHPAPVKKVRFDPRAVETTPVPERVTRNPPTRHNIPAVSTAAKTATASHAAGDTVPIPVSPAAKTRGPVRHTQPNYPGQTTTSPAQSQPSHSKPCASPSSEFNLELQRRNEELVVATLSSELPTVANSDALFKFTPDRNFSVLDCKLLALLKAKHASPADKWVELQSQFLEATGQFGDIRPAEGRAGGRSRQVRHRRRRSRRGGREDAGVSA